MSRPASHGFTLIEALLSVTLISMIAAISMPLLASFNRRNDLDITTQSLVQALRRANSYARNGQGGANWGVYVSPATAVVYKGASYASRDASADEAVGLAGGITPANTVDVSFAKQSGLPSSASSIILNAANDNRTISVNARGMVAY